MNRRLTTMALSLLLALGTAACGGSEDGGVAVEDVRARAQPVSVGVSAIYMDLTNDTEEDIELVGASVPGEIAGYTELHETRMVGDDESPAMDMSDEEMSDGAMTDDGGGASGMEGMEGMEMVQVEGIPVAAGETVSLEPGGLHVMLLELADDLEDGETFEATLEFEDGTSETIEVTVTSSP